jgi:hexosaminidase
MTPGGWTYFDHYQSEDKEREPLAIGGFTDLEKVYGYHPVPGALSGEKAKHVLGSQFQIWTEYMKTSRQVEYMAYPRACALAEVLWASPAERDFAEFTARLKVHLQRLDRMGVNYRPLSGPAWPRY